jgi:transcriptional regulator with XRE-family HTH domain
MPKVYITNSVRKFRELRRLNVIQLADISGVSAATIHRLEDADGHVNTHIDSAWLLSKALDCAMTDLFAFNAQPKNPADAA